LVQPCGCRVRDGILHTGADPAILDQVSGVEKATVESGIHLITYWLEVSDDEQAWRLAGRTEVPYEKIERADITLPRRHAARSYAEPDLPRRHIPEPY
jgi:polyphosphate kinase 2 (PPK2 family)